MKIAKIIKYLFASSLILFIVWRQAPIFISNLELEGTTVDIKSYEVFGQKEAATFPLPNQNSIAIFWASWCAPCRLEMARLKHSVDSGAIKQEQVFAINMSEDKNTIKRFLYESEYPFTFIDAPLLPQKMNIQVTPTLVLFEDNQVKSSGSGISLIGIWRVEQFLSQP
jgi:cytochrome c biogenesis protein CcmG, thiol:disulfide interchange protein DsbE